MKNMIYRYFAILFIGASLTTSDANAQTQSSSQVENDPTFCSVVRDDSYGESAKGMDVFILKGTLHTETSNCGDSFPKTLPLQVPIAIGQGGGAKVLLGGKTISMDLVGVGSSSEGISVKGSQPFSGQTLSVEMKTGPLQPGKAVSVTFDQRLGGGTPEKKECRVVFQCK